MIMTGFSLLLELRSFHHQMAMSHSQLLWLLEAVPWPDQFLLLKLQGFPSHNQRATIPQDQLEAVQ